MRSLVLYFSVTNNTKVVAKEIAKQMKADIQEIKPIKAYAKDYEKVLAKGIKEIKSNYKPEIYDLDIDFDKYDMIFIGSPNWLDKYAPPIATFLDEYKIEYKIVVPFVTHGKGGKGIVDAEIRKQLPKCRVLDSIAIQGRGGETLSHDIEIAIARKNLHNLNMPVVRW